MTLSSLLCNEATWLWTFIQALAVTVMLPIIMYQIRLQRLSDTVNSMCTLQARWNSESMIRARRIVCHRWLNGQHSFDGISEYISEFIEELAQYYQSRSVSKHALWSAYSWYIEHYYIMFKEGITKDRSNYNDPTLYEGFDLLFVEMTRISKKKGAPDVERDSEAIEAFARNEIQVSQSYFTLSKQEWDEVNHISVENICNSEQNA